jgi:excisionase family DNA binding protein
MSIETLYTKQEAARILKISPNTISNLICSRQITVIKGRPVLIPESAIKNFLQKRTKRAVV